MRKKRELVIYSFYDWSGWQRHLEKMARKGWMLDKISNFCVTYHRSDPREMQYAVTYLPEASEFNPRPPESQQTFEEFCAQAGWARAASWHQMQVFRAPVEAPPLETDARLQVQTVCQAMKKNFLPGHIVLLLLALLQLAVRLHALRDGFLVEIHSNTDLLMWGLWCLLALYSALELGTYLLWLRRARETADREGRLLNSRSHPMFQQVAAALVVALALLWLLSFTSVYQRSIAVYGMAAAVLATLSSVGARALLRRLGVKAGISRLLTVGITFAVLLILTFAAQGVLDHIQRVTHGSQLQNSAEDLPLIVEDVADLDGEECIYDFSASRSLLLSADFGCQYNSWGNLILQYTIYEAPFEWILDESLNDLMDDYDAANRYMSKEYMYCPADPAPWGAEEVWLLYEGAECQQRWIIRWEDRLVELYYLVDGYGLTEEQIPDAARKLSAPKP